MRAIVDGVARDHEADRGDVQAGRLIGIGVADIDRDDLVAFKVEPPQRKSKPSPGICANVR
jgi:hypothetical protein